MTTLSVWEQRRNARIMKAIEAARETNEPETPRDTRTVSMSSGPWPDYMPRTSFDVAEVMTMLNSIDGSLKTILAILSAAQAKP